jgi:hypothetical protein
MVLTARTKALGRPAALDPHSMAVIKRLEGERRAADAFKIFNIGPKKGARIIQACMEADELARTFDARMRLERRMLGRDGKPGRADKLEKEIADLKAFFGEVNRPRSDYLSAGIYLLRRRCERRQARAIPSLQRDLSTSTSCGRDIAPIGCNSEKSRPGWQDGSDRVDCGGGSPSLRSTASEGYGGTG